MKVVPGVEGGRSEGACGSFGHEPLEDRVQLLVDEAVALLAGLPDVEDPERSVGLVEAGGVDDKPVGGAGEVEGRSDTVVVVVLRSPSTIGNSWMYATAMTAPWSGTFDSRRCVALRGDTSMVN